MNSREQMVVFLGKKKQLSQLKTGVRSQEAKTLPSHKRDPPVALTQGENESSETAESLRVGDQKADQQHKRTGGFSRLEQMRAATANNTRNLSDQEMKANCLPRVEMNVDSKSR